MAGREKLTWKAVVLVIALLVAGGSLVVWGHGDSGGLVIVAATTIALGIFGFNIKQGGRSR